MIESKNNEKIKYFRKLRDKKYILEEKKYIIEGEHLVEEAIKNNMALEIILLDGKTYNTSLPKIYVNNEVLKNISLLDTPQSIMALVKLSDNKNIGKRIVILDGIQDPGNAGTIIRNSVAFNIDTVVFTEGSVYPYNDKVIRASQGMIFNINICILSLNEVIKELKDKNIKIYGTSMNGIDLKNIKPVDKYGIIFGNEGAGISKYSMDNSNELIRIEMNDNCESLNVGVSSGIILYKFMVKR